MLQVKDIRKEYRTGTLVQKALDGANVLPNSYMQHFQIRTRLYEACDPFVSGLLHQWVAPLELLYGIHDNETPEAWPRATEALQVCIADAQTKAGLKRYFTQTAEAV